MYYSVFKIMGCLLFIWHSELLTVDTTPGILISLISEPSALIFLVTSLALYHVQEVGTAIFMKMKF